MHTVLTVQLVLTYFREIVSCNVQSVIIQIQASVSSVHNQTVLFVIYKIVKSVRMGIL